MRNSRLTMVLALGAALFVTACGEDDPAPPALEKFTATLLAANEVPPVNLPGATGTATFTLNAAGDQLTYTMSASGLTGAATNAHIHLGAAGVAVSGNVIVPLAFNAGATAGTVSVTAPPPITATSVTGTTGGVANTFASLLAAMRNGTAYVNIHTAANGGGEIRGQLIKQ